MKLATSLFVLGLVSLSTISQASSVLDQNNPPLPQYTSLNNNISGVEYSQQVTAGISGTLSGIELYSVISPAFSDLVTITSGTTTLFSGTESFGSSSTSPYVAGTLFDLSSANINLTAGETFTINVFGGPAGQLGASTATYAGGALTETIGGTPVASSGSINSLAFQTYVTPVPLPAALPLLVSGLAGLGAWSRRRKMSVAC